MRHNKTSAALFGAAVIAVSLAGLYLGCQAARRRAEPAASEERVRAAAARLGLEVRVPPLSQAGTVLYLCRPGVPAGRLPRLHEARPAEWSGVVRVVLAAGGWGEAPGDEDSPNRLRLPGCSLFGDPGLVRAVGVALAQPE